MKSKISNPMLSPVTKEQQNWTWYSMFSFWMTSVHSLAGYTVAASFFLYGLPAWEVFISLLSGMMVMLLMSNLAGKPGQRGGVPYCILCRQAFGIRGAIIPSIIRGITAFSWYGIQTYLVSNALLLSVLKIFPVLITFTKPHFLGLSLLGWSCFLFIWLIQLILFQFGMDLIKKFIDFAGPAVYLVMFILMLYIVSKAGFHNISFSAGSRHLSLQEQVIKIITGAAFLISYFSSQILTFADFSRYCRSYEKDLKRGNILGLPVNYIVFAIICVTIVSGTQPLYGRLILEPVEMINEIDNTTAIIIGVMTMIIATVGVNIVANFVSSAFDLSNIKPDKISFRMGGSIAAIGSVLILPWLLFNSPQTMSFTIGILSTFIAPLFGILVADFYHINKQQLNITELYNAESTGIYYFYHGFNLAAIISMVLVGCIDIIMATIPLFSKYSDFVCILGMFLGGIVYLYLMKYITMFKYIKISEGKNA